MLLALWFCLYDVLELIFAVSLVVLSAL